MLLTYIRVTLESLSPWRVGAPTKDRSRQATLTDLSGSPVIPPSSLAGSFRSHLGDSAESLMGKAEEEKSRASAVWFLGTRLVGRSDEEPRVESRTGTPISRTRKAASAHGSHEIDEVYDTRYVTLYLRCDAHERDVLQALSTWHPTIGGGITTGLGRAKVHSIRYRTLDTSRPDDVSDRATMGTSGPEGVDQLLTKGEDWEVPDAHQPIVLTATLDIADHLLAGRESDGGDRREHNWYHGSRWKGVLRSRIEYIGRSIELAVCGADDETWEGCGRCSVCEVFGSGTTGAGRWVFEFTRLSEPPPLGQGRTRNAIDRFTGGVLDKRLFYEDTSNTRNASLVITQRAVLEPHHTWVVKALLLALKDLDDGYIGIGGRSATGLGSVRIKKWTLGPAIQEVVGTCGLGQLPLVSAADLAADHNARTRLEKEMANA